MNIEQNPEAWKENNPADDQNNQPELQNQEPLSEASESELDEHSAQADEDLSGFLDRTLSDNEDRVPIQNDRPLTKNLLGDNPPGAEQAAFDAGNSGDAGSELFKYNAENLVEGFRENLDKTQQQTELDKRLKGNSLD